MSLISDALKKAERDRQKATAPVELPPPATSIPAETTTPSPPKSRLKLIAFIAIPALVVLGVTYYLLNNNSSDVAPSVKIAQNSPAKPATPSVAASPAKPPAPPTLASTPAKPMETSTVTASTPRRNVAPPPPTTPLVSNNPVSTPTSPPPPASSPSPSPTPAPEIVATAPASNPLPNLQNHVVDATQTPQPATISAVSSPSELVSASPPIAAAPTTPVLKAESSPGPTSSIESSKPAMTPTPAVVVAAPVSSPTPATVATPVNKPVAPTNPNPAIQTYVDQFTLSGVSIGGVQKILIKSQVFSPGDLINTDLKIKLISVKPHDITFADESGFQYHRRY